MNTYTPNFKAFVADSGTRGSPHKAALRLRLIVYLMAVDILALGAAFLASRVWASGQVVVADLRILCGALLPIYIVSAFTIRTYAVAISLNYRDSVARALLALALSSAILVLMLSALSGNISIPGPGILTTALLAAAMMATLRLGHVAYASHRLEGRLDSLIELYDGDPPAGLRLGRGCDTSTFFDPVRPNPFSLDHLAHVVGRSDRVVLHCAPDRRGAWGQVLQSMNVHAEIVVQEWSGVRPIGISSHVGATTMVVARGPLNTHQRIMKRGFDMAFAGLVLLALSPLLILVALAIKLDSPGPVFFLQPRIGRQNRLFSVIKFRSMHSERCDALGNQSTSRNDPRTTRVGRIIRRTSIDELPQFLNVLNGDMSVVGPRPHAISSTAEALLFWEADDRYWHRHAARPGLTGRAQIEGFRGATTNVSDLTGRVGADLQYLQSWSFWSDMAIIAKTFRALLHSNAY